MDIRERARKYLLQVPPYPAEVTSTGISATLFTRLTGGMTQASLQENWKNGGHQTSCNSFVANYAGDAGIGIGKVGRSLGQFGLDKKLATWRKDFAWIPATEGARPKYGDIFELANRLHQGVSLDFVDDVWNTVEGGQGGPSTGYDIIKRKRSQQSGNVIVHDKGGPREVVKGWVDIELFANGPPPPPPTTVPEWLLGWWSVPWRGRIFYYFFEAGFKASWTLTRPISNAFAPMRFEDTATVTMDNPQSVALKWSKTGSVEKLAQTGNASEMTGTWNGTEQIVATKLF